MKSTSRLCLILALGIVALGGAWWLRSTVEAKRKLLASGGVAAPIDPRRQQIQAHLASLESAVTKAPGNINQRWALADAYQQIGDLGRAGQQLAAIIKLQPQSEPARLALANTHLAMQNWSEAEATYREIIRRQPRSLEAWQGLAAVLYHQERFFEAIETARKTVALKPGDHNNHYLLATSLLEYATQFPNATNHTKELSEARAEFEQLLKSWKNQSDVYYRLGRVCIGLKDGQSAIRYLRQAQKMAPKWVDVSILLARAYMIAGDRTAALKTVEATLSTTSDNAALHNLRGELLQTSTDPQAAQQTLESFLKAVQLDSKNATYLEDLGLAYLRLGKLNEARVAFEQSLSLDPNNKVPYQQLAPIYTRLGDPEKADKYAKISTQIVFNDSQLAQVENLAQLHPRSVPLQLILADRYRDLKMPSAARDKYLLVLQLDPKNARAKAGLAALKKAEGAAK